MLADLCVQRKQAESEFHEKAEALYCIREEKWADLVQAVQVVQFGRCKSESFQLKKRVLKKRVLLCLIPQYLQCRCVSEGVIELETGMVCKWWLSQDQYSEAFIKEALLQNSILKKISRAMEMVEWCLISCETGMFSESK